MIATSFQISDALQLTPVAPSSVAEACQATDARIWLDLAAPAPDELAEWLDTLGVGGLSQRLCLEAGDRAGFYPLRSELILVVPALIWTGEEPAVAHVTILCRQNLLLTVHSQPILNPERVAAAADEAEAWLPGRSTAGLVSALLLDLSQDSLDHIIGLRRSILVLEEQMDRRPETVEAEAILDLRSDLLAHESVVGDRLPPMQALQSTEKPYFKLADAREYLNYVLANLQAADRTIERLDARIGALRAGFQMHAQDKTNRRLGMLTILSAIFMPITLLAGIWGMNFEGMPELGIAFGYPLALMAMALIGVGMYRFFRKDGWFD